MSISSVTVATELRDEITAVAELKRQIVGDGLQAVLLFVSSGYNLDRLAAAIRDAFPVPVVGCTTAGHIGPGGYRRRGILATGISGTSISVRTVSIQPLDRCQSLVADLEKKMRAIPIRPGARRFGLLLVDGLSRMEERLAAALHHCFPDMPLIGGSAGDDLAFQATYVYADGRFQTGAAALTIVETTAAFSTFKFQHFDPTPEILVVTEADSDSRIVYEINGEPAARAYARLIDHAVDDLAPAVFSQFPLMLKAGSDYYIRSIQQCNRDLSLTFYCAIAAGIVLRLGRPVNPLETAERALAQVRLSVPEPALIIGCDCILRRLEFEQSGILQQMGEVLAHNRVIGFSTYGEQFNALHMNQTFTGLAIGEG